MFSWHSAVFYCKHVWNIHIIMIKNWLSIIVNGRNVFFNTIRPTYNTMYPDVPASCQRPRSLYRIVFFYFRFQVLVPVSISWQLNYQKYKTRGVPVSRIIKAWNIRFKCKIYSNYVVVVFRPARMFTGKWRNPKSCFILLHVHRNDSERFDFTTLNASYR